MLYTFKKYTTLPQFLTVQKVHLAKNYTTYRRVKFTHSMLTSIFNHCRHSYQTSITLLNFIGIWTNATPLMHVTITNSATVTTNTHINQLIKSYRGASSFTVKAMELNDLGSIHSCFKLTTKVIGSVKNGILPMLFFRNNVLQHVPLYKKALTQSNVQC